MLTDSYDKYDEEQDNKAEEIEDKVKVGKCVIVDFPPREQRQLRSVKLWHK